MKRLAAVAVVAAGLAFPVLGQRGAVRGGGFSGPHVSAPVSGPRGGFGSVGTMPRGGGSLPGRGFPSGAGVGIRPAPRGFAPNPNMYRFAPRTQPFAPRTQPFAPRTQPSTYRPFNHGNTVVPAHWHGHDGDWDHHHRGIYFHGAVYPYSYWYAPYPVFTGYVNPWLFGNCWSPWYGWSAWCDVNGYQSYSGDIPGPYREYGTDSGSDSGLGPYPQQYYQDQAVVPPGQPQSLPEAQPTRPEYSPSSAPSAVSAVRQQTVTVIFNDGRPPERIQNYLLTSRMLTVLDPNYREIPLAKVNLAATVQANRAAGVEFRVPDAQ